MLTRTCVPHYPPATYYPTILPHSRCTRGEGSRPKKEFFAKAKRYRKNIEKKRNKVEGKNVEKEMLKETLYIFAVKYYKSRR